jgi:phosphoglycerol transferase MdoB-like AlkP superfamily enzyme
MSHWRARVKVLAAVVLLLLLVNAKIDITSGHFSSNRVANELALNGVYAFFNAATTSRMDYHEYYLSLPREEAFQRLRKLVAQPNATFIPGAANPIARHIEYKGAMKPLNVIVLLQESLGAEFVGVYGDQRGLTPNLDRIAKNSIMFTNVYATGTRTVRGMEAVTASFPPVPAESIVKRPANEGMFNWSTVMSRNGYTPTFIYGGFGTFDNMNYYFGHNGYRVVDRTDMDEPKFSNIWGVSDEDAYRNAIRIFDEQYKRGEKIFSVIMSTSNHKPFTFPEGVPGVAQSGGGRKAGVRYADYAIGKFFEEIKTKPYFDETVIVIVGDHGARVYGRDNIPMRTYELPLLVYAPKYFKPQTVNTLTSQIDIAPTVLGLLEMSYDSVFFGKDIFLSNPEDRFVVLNHNRDIGLYDGYKLTELHFRRTSSSSYYDKENNIQAPAPHDEEHLKNMESVFQSAYDFYVNRLYQLKLPASEALINEGHSARSKN